MPDTVTPDMLEKDAAFLAELATAAREKSALFGMDTPGITGQNLGIAGLGGAALGGLAGYMSGDDEDPKRRRSSAMTGALAGAGIGLGGVLGTGAVRGLLAKTPLEIRNERLNQIDGGSGADTVANTLHSAWRRFIPGSQDTLPESVGKLVNIGAVGVGARAYSTEGKMLKRFFRPSVFGNTVDDLRKLIVDRDLGAAPADVRNAARVVPTFRALFRESLVRPVTNPRESMRNLWNKVQGKPSGYANNLLPSDFTAVPASKYPALGRVGRAAGVAALPAIAGTALQYGSRYVSPEYRALSNFKSLTPEQQQGLVEYIKNRDTQAQ